MLVDRRLHRISSAASCPLGTTHIVNVNHFFNDFLFCAVSFRLSKRCVCISALLDEKLRVCPTHTDPVSAIQSIRASLLKCLASLGKLQNGDTRKALYLSHLTFSESRC